MTRQLAHTKAESADGKQRVLKYIDTGIGEKAKLIIHGRKPTIVGTYPDTCFLNPTVFGDVKLHMTIAREEIFGPVASVMRAKDLNEAINWINSNNYGNAASIFTSNGKAAKEFQYRVECGNIGVDVGVVAPMAFFPFGGMKDSFYGVLHGQGRDAVRFSTESKVVIQRWFQTEGRQVIINTCSGAISLAKELENKSAKFQEDLSRRYTSGRDLFLSFAKENADYATQVDRAYYGVITDAIEGCSPRAMLQILKKEKLVLDWRKKQQSRAAVRLCIEQMLEQLPTPPFTPNLSQEISDATYQHVYEAYFGEGKSIYEHVGIGEPPIAGA